MACPNYDLPDDWESMTVEEKQKFFGAFRGRLQWFRQQKAKHDKAEAERREAQKSRFKVNKTLK
ncbi:hypothetical protein M1M34_gp082 [Haloarcula tailed virus 2]|uniref:Uncharacterized protein n=1 Tax=Haloarcula tailed virus 2 TaxID=2877989 RepID=A0AAE8XZD4_9CAUD|nr:hypothetical protein M1M34_gp082 [Haloarcula tailed virus 2]UBF23251.1 hypothetical protein HATV-2_gp100 [Haloarcula tailed virus 2]